MSSYDPAFEEPQSHTGTWIATVLLILSFVVGLVIFPPLYDSPPGNVPSTVLFIGRFHPILLHLPIGALIFLAFMELGCLTRRGESKYGAAALMALFIGAMGSVFAVLAGIMLSREGGYSGGSFSLHQTMGIIGTTGVLLALVVRLVAMGQRNWELLHAYRALFFISFGVMSLGAHFGGNISHGSKFLTEHAPEPLKSQMISAEKWMLGFVEKPKAPVVAPEVKPLPAEPAKVDPTIAPASIPPAPITLPTPAPTPSVPNPAPMTAQAVVSPAPTEGEKRVFQDVILPIFEAKCNKCHGEEKDKGGLRLHTFADMMKGGDEAGDKNIVPGKPDESVTYQLISSTEDAEGHMPPEGKEQLTSQETAIIKWWIEKGATDTQKVAEAQFPAELQPVVDALLKK